MAIEETLKMKEEMPMSPEEEMKSPEQEVAEGSSEEEMDLKIAVLMGERLLEGGGFDVIQKATKSSSDPGQVIGQFLMQMGQQMMENMPDGITLSPKIMLAQNGWVEQISDYIQQELGVKKAIMDKAEIYVASTVQQMAQAKQGMTSGVQAPPTPQVGAEQPMAAAPAMPMQAGGM